VGAGLYAHVYPLLKNAILRDRMLGYLTIDQLLNVNHWVVIISLSLMILIVFYLVEMYERKRKL
jgi:hypothetical protein